MDNIKKLTISKLVEFLGEVLGEKYEIVFHEINEDKRSSIVAIANNHISNRNVNSPLTGFALELLKTKTYEEQDYLVGYKAVTQQGKDIKGSTFFIKDGKKIQGMLCINHDNSEYKSIADRILKLGNIQKNSEISSNNPLTQNLEAVEYLSESIEDVLADVIEPSILNSDTILKPQKKQEIINALHSKGIFNVKGAVLKVSKILNMSEQSVYRYLKKVDN